MLYHYVFCCDCWLQVICKQESLLLFSDQKTVDSWIDALTKAVQLVFRKMFLILNFFMPFLACLC